MRAFWRSRGEPGSRTTGAGAATDGGAVAVAVERSIWRFVDGRLEADTDLTVAEAPLTIDVDGEELVTLLCTPSAQRELAIGFLFAEGLIGGYSDILEVSLDEARGKVSVTTRSRRRTAAELLGRRTLTSGCGRGSVFYSVNDVLDLSPLPAPDTGFGGDAEPAGGPAFDPEVLLRTMRRWQKETPLFATTGGAHAAALVDRNGQVLAPFEDIGRHNAVDKVIGFCLLSGLATSGRALLTTGRLSSEMVVKAVRARVPVVASRSAPTALACEFAQRLGVTLVGFARGARLNVYAHPGRLVGGGADGTGMTGATGGTDKMEGADE